MPRPHWEGQASFISTAFQKKREEAPYHPNRLFFGSEHERTFLERTATQAQEREGARPPYPAPISSHCREHAGRPGIALDPELLGKGFRKPARLYNETKTTARKRDGLLLPPRPIVDYMVDRSLRRTSQEQLPRPAPGERTRRPVSTSLLPSPSGHPFSEQVCHAADAIHTCDSRPACGSGAFPMGMLQARPYIIHKIDPDNARWKQLQIDAAAKIQI